MDKKALSAEAPSQKNGAGKIALTLSRIVVVYYLVSLFFSVFNPIAVHSAVLDHPLKQVFDDIGSYRSALTNGGVEYFSATVLTAIAYIMLATMVIGSLALVLSVFDGRPKKVAVITMGASLGVTGIASAVAGVLSFTMGGMAVSKPYSFLAAALFIAAAVCCIVTLKSKACAPMFDRNVDTGKIGGKLTSYFEGSWAEIKKIVWPDRKTVLKNTGIVLLFILLIGAAIWLTDWLWSLLFGLAFGGK